MHASSKDKALKKQIKFVNMEFSLVFLLVSMFSNFDLTLSFNSCKLKLVSQYKQFGKGSRGETTPLPMPKMIMVISNLSIRDNDVKGAKSTEEREDMKESHLSSIDSLQNEDK